MAESPEQDQQPPRSTAMLIAKIYAKDISFESPTTPEVFKGPEWSPEVNMQLSNATRALNDDTYEVTLSTTVTAKIGDKIAYLAEVHQAGLFQFKGFAEPGVARALNTACLNILFPYAREAISSLVAKGGFPHLELAPVNFDALFAAHQRQNEKQPDAATEGPPGG